MSGLIQFGLRLDRERFVTLLARLGDPHRRLRCIHVAGTNGKGSTTTFLSSILRAAGYKTGAYLSPYVFDLRERVQIDGEMIPAEDFARWVTTIRPHIEAVTQTDLGSTTEFELKTAVAFCWFAEQNVDYAVIEVGIGGRLDSTNVIPPPLVAVITTIGWDHMKLLGNTLGKIAGEKAGIFKTGTIGVTAVPPGEALDVIIDRARQTDIPLRRVAAEGEPGAEAAYLTYRRDTDSELVDFQLPSGDLLAVRLGLRGSYQAGNAATALAAIETLSTDRGIAISDEAIRKGLENAFIPGRFQLIERADGAALVLDGAHNEDGAKTLLAALTDRFGPERKYTFVYGTRRNHDPLPFLTLLQPVAARIVATEPPFKPTPAEDTANVARSLGIKATIHPNTSDAIRETWAKAAPGEVVVVTGSLYVVGETPVELRLRS